MDILSDFSSKLKGKKILKGWRLKDIPFIIILGICFLAFFPLIAGFIVSIFFMINLFSGRYTSLLVRKGFDGLLDGESKGFGYNKSGGIRHDFWINLFFIMEVFFLYVAYVEFFRVGFTESLIFLFIAILVHFLQGYYLITRSICVK